MLNLKSMMQKQQKGKQKKKKEFSDLYKKFNEVNDAATRKKKDNEVIDLIDDIKNEDNLFNDTFKADPEDIFIHDNLFHSFGQNDKKDTKMVSDDIPEDKNLDQNNVLFGQLPTRPVKRQIIKPNTILELTANKNKK